MTTIEWTKRVIDVPGLFESRPRAYEQCVAAGPFIFVSGQIGYDGDRLVSTGFAQQVRQTFRNVEVALQAAGAELTDLVSMTVYLTDPRFMEPFLALRTEILAGSYATSSMICVDKLYEPELLVEISAVALSGSGK